MKTKKTFYKKFGKRWFDLLLTVPGFVVISPLMGFIALLVRLQLGSPGLFKQVRPGFHGKPVTLY
ncbi:MAG: sugar transferase [Desulfobacterales bacterium]|nr:sugar transferase [Desulfobacterales bacterium]